MSVSSRDEKSSKELQSSHTQVEALEAGTSGVQDVFGDETGHAIQYKTLSWQVSPFKPRNAKRHIDNVLTSCTVRQLIDDCRDREQWHAITSKCNGVRWYVSKPKWPPTPSD